MRDGEGRFLPGHPPGPGRPPGIAEEKPRRLPRIYPARNLVRIQWGKLDGRSAPARALVAKVRAHQEQLGGEVSTRQAVLIDKLAKLELISELLEVRLLPKVCTSGTLSDAELSQWLAILDRIARLCSALGIHRSGARQPRSLEDWLRDAQAAQDACEGDGAADSLSRAEIDPPGSAQEVTGAAERSAASRDGAR